jgi:hypothetical protein
MRMQQSIAAIASFAKASRSALLSFAAVAFAVAAAFTVAMVLNSYQEASWAAFTTSGARVGDPGNNLTGPT